MAATSQLAFLLTHQLATDEAASVPSNASTTLQQLETHRLIKEVEQEARDGNAQNGEKAASMLHRWQLRITSLVSSKLSSAQAAGFALALQTSRQSENLFLQHSKQWYNSALALVTRKSLPVDSLAVAASTFLLFSYEKASQFQEYAREVANPAGVRKFGEGLLAIASSESIGLEARIHALNSLSDLVRISASPLRPIAQQLQLTSVTLLCQWSDSSSCSAEGQEAAARLLGHVYITAGKVQAGQSWKRTVESLVGSSHALLGGLVSTLIEEYGSPANLAPLDMPPLPGQASRSADQTDMVYPALQRLETIFSVLLSMLGASTERAVPVPIGVLVRLCQRLFSLTVHSPLKERHDPNLNLVQMSLLPRLHVLGCKMLGQLAKSLGSYLTVYTTHLLAQIAFVQGTYPSGSAIRCSFYAVTSLLIQSCPVHPDEGSKSLSKIVRSILEDAVFLVDPEEGRKSSSSGKEGAVDVNKNGERKAKRQKMYEATEMNGRRRVDALEVAIVRHGMTSLRRILAAGAWLLPPGQLNLVLRLLLAFSLSPTFFTASPPPATYSLLSEALSLCPSLRSTILSCLVAAIHTVARESSGLIDHATAVFRRGLGSNVSEKEKRICKEGLAAVDGVARPSVPPLLRTKGMRLALEELTAGGLDKEWKGRDDEGEDSEDQEKFMATARSAYQPDNATIPMGPRASQQPQPAASSVSEKPPVAVLELSAQPTVPSTKGVSAWNPTRAPVLEALPSPTAPTTAVRPPAPPTESVNEKAVPDSIVPNTAIEADAVQDTEVLVEDPNNILQAEAEKPKRTIAAKQAGAEGMEDSDSDDDAPLPKIVMSDSEVDE